MGTSIGKLEGIWKLVNLKFMKKKEKKKQQHISYNNRYFEFMGASKTT